MAEWNGDEHEEDDEDERAADKCDLSDGEGVWSQDIEQSFMEALAIYPPCGRRKIILSDEGKMYGRNELIARYIKLRTGKTRTRKQVSSHIQVLARKKSRELQCKLKDQVAKEKAMQSLAGMSSAQIVSASAIHNKSTGNNMGGMAPYGGMSADRSAFPASAPTFWQSNSQPMRGASQAVSKSYHGQQSHAATNASTAIHWEGCGIGTPRFKLIEFSAFMEQQHNSDSYTKHLFVHLGGPATDISASIEAVDIRQIYDKFPEKKGGLRDLYEKGPQDAFFLVKFWADLNTEVQEEAGAFYGVTSIYESVEDITITCSTKVCSFGKQVVEKLETEHARYENQKYVYQIVRSPMCEYMINFIHKLKQLPEKYMMNSVLENFTILQVVSNRDTQEILLCIAYVYEVSTSEHGAQHHIYKLVKD